MREVLLAAEGITVPMAIVDFIPVALFFVATILLQRDLYRQLKTWGFACLAAGSIMVFVGGFYKALWKILFAVGAGDFVQLNEGFFPMQGTGFLLIFLGLLSVYLGKRNRTLALTPVSIAFIGGQVVGFGGAQAVLAVWAAKLKKPLAILFFVISFIAMLGMGYLSAKFDDSSSMHWMAQLTNIVSTGSFLVGVLMLHFGGLRKMKF